MSARGSECHMSERERERERKRRRNSLQRINFLRHRWRWGNSFLKDQKIFKKFLRTIIYQPSFEWRRRPRLTLFFFLRGQEFFFFHWFLFRETAAHLTLLLVGAKLWISDNRKSFFLFFSATFFCLKMVLKTMTMTKLSSLLFVVIVVLVVAVFVPGSDDNYL